MSLISPIRFWPIGLDST
ncbi:hypothetical protein LINPERPRIM_LOCUS34363 [Linum perenne]